MNEPNHHVPDAMLAAYAAGSLPYPFAVLVSAHISACDECRSRHGSHLLLGGLVLDRLSAEPVSDTLRARTLQALDAPAGPRPRHDPFEIYPPAIAQLLCGAPPRWRSLGVGTKQAIIWRGGEGSVRLLSIPAGQAVPDHGHRGIELTLVLSGSFSDEVGTFGPGDLEVADEVLVHVPRAGPETPCICAAATDAPLRFQSFLPRLLQPLLRI
jgi:putative transcriptional regulator